MPRVDILRETAVKRSTRVKQLEGMFDLPPTLKSSTRWSVDLPLEQRPWLIGLIVGPSGCGKSTIARQLFADSFCDGYEWDATASIVDGFPEACGIKEVTGLLSSVGFSSPPSWLRSFQNLSNGEQFRVTVARALAENAGRLVVIDEFTSVVDRTVAKIGSAAVAKTIRSRNNGQLVAVACHHDIIDWLQPDWVFEPATNRFTWRCLQRRPDIRLDIHRCPNSYWQLFRHHHYLNTSLSRFSECYLATIENRPIAFCSAIRRQHPVGQIWTEHRCVCLPDFQGVGIGNAISDFVASIYSGCGFIYSSVTSHPAMARHRARSPNWKMLRKPGLKDRQSIRHIKGSSDRLTISFKWVGVKMVRQKAEEMRRLDFSSALRARPNATIKVLANHAQVCEGQMAGWLQSAVAAGTVVRSGTGRGVDRITYRLHER